MKIQRNVDAVPRFDIDEREGKGNGKELTSELAEDGKEVCVVDEIIDVICK